MVPNLLQTGAGSPTGITVYEGTLLPKVFQNQMIHCDAGPNVCRAYPVTKDGAGYTAEIVNVLFGARDNWFRPSDVCVAPDGSLFVADWYDPGVGGHNQQEVDKGRIFRVAPTGVKYSVPKFDFSTAGRSRRGLEEPELLGSLSGFHGPEENGQTGRPALAKLYDDKSNPRIRARALWVWGQIEGEGQTAVAAAIKDADPDIRITGVRLARQLKLDRGQGRAAIGQRSRPGRSAPVRHRLASQQGRGSGRAMGRTGHCGTTGRIAGTWKHWGSEPTRTGMPSWTLIWPRPATSGTRPRDATSSGAAALKKTPELLVKIIKDPSHQEGRSAALHAGVRLPGQKSRERKSPAGIAGTGVTGHDPDRRSLNHRAGLKARRAERERRRLIFSVR